MCSSDLDVCSSDLATSSCTLSASTCAVCTFTFLISAAILSHLLFDEIHYLDIVDCNAGDHHKAFATNFNPEINIREITQRGKYFEDGEWKETDPLSVHKALNYPNVGPKESYLMYHEELESLTKNFPTLKRARFWMTFGQEYLTHLRVIQNIGMVATVVVYVIS